ncbi:Uma2 family endonuclease [Puia sp. P3]|uniref:Uma2 family endonuclease n=1 Tax=Puia sp. P3 TaxID=3423952 RepID=UPI003D67BF37
MLYEFKGFRPLVDPSAFVHPQAAVTGNVTIGENVYIGPGAAIRGDWGGIVIEDGCNVQENCTIHMFPGVVVRLREGAHIGHGAIIHGAQIGRNCLIGMNSVIMDNAEIGDECIIGALSFVKAAEKIPKRSVVAGNPAKIIKEVSDEMLNWKTEGTAIYQALPGEMRKYWGPVEGGAPASGGPSEIRLEKGKEYDYKPWKDSHSGENKVGEAVPAYGRQWHTTEQYFIIEDSSPVKHEYHKGQVIAMASATFDHNLICSNLLFRLRSRFSDKTCHVLGSDMRVFIEAEDLFTYLDALIFCGEPEFRQNDQYNLMNPKVLFEVLSPSTKGYEKNTKFELYKSLPSFREYILIDSKMVMVQQMVKNAEGVWQSRRIESLEEDLLIETTGTRVPLKEIYEETRFQS